MPQACGIFISLYQKKKQDSCSSVCVSMCVRACVFGGGSETENEAVVGKKALAAIMATIIPSACCPLDTRRKVID